ncbi:hypothetical protein [Mycobacterium leprae]|uniref:hypothetical protein n=1 Tax=Mycobacterium leprae TaxID=1769 RepID=UPI000AFE8A96|nr:hypothetical protein [Mycobacterium leprae]
MIDFTIDVSSGYSSEHAGSKGSQDQHTRVKTDCSKSVVLLTIDDTQRHPAIRRVQLTGDTAAK